MKKRFLAASLVSVIFLVGILSTPAFAASPKPTATKKPATSVAGGKSKKTPIPVPKKTISSTKKTSPFMTKGKKDPSDTDIAPTITQLSASALGENGAVFKLPDVASAKLVLSQIIADLAEGGIKCESIDPTIAPLITLDGNLKDDTVAACQSGDPADTGFIEYVITDKAAVAKYNSAQNIAGYLNFVSPQVGKGEQTQFTPSSRVALFVVGGEYAFDASEISWAVLYNSRFTPPARTNATTK